MPVGDLTPPERHYSLFWKDLTSNIEEVIDAFERRIRPWYLDQAYILIDQMPGKEFIITNIGCFLADTISQFREGAEAHNAQVFEGFTEEHFPAFDEPLRKTIPSHLVVASIHDVDTISEAFYTGFRCGLAHSGTILAFGGHSVDTDGKLYEVHFEPDEPMGHCYDEQTDEKYPFVVMNPIRLIEEIEKAFKEYLFRLRNADDDSDLRNNFARKIEYDFGEYDSRLRESLE